MFLSNLLEYSDNYSITSASLWNYYRDEVNDDANKNVDANSKISNNNDNNNNNKITSKCFKYNIEVIASTPNNNSRFKPRI